LATIRNLYVDAGSDYSTVVTVASSNGSPLILTNFTAKSQMRKSVGSSTAYDFTAEIFDAANGKIRLSLTAEDSEGIPPGRWMYDCEITNTVTGKKKRVIEGIVTVTPQITQI
jgi:hypothetical protein